jgi:hypothetical protein
VLNFVVLKGKTRYPIHSAITSGYFIIKSPGKALGQGINRFLGARAIGVAEAYGGPCLAEIRSDEWAFCEHRMKRGAQRDSVRNFLRSCQLRRESVAHEDGMPCARGTELDLQFIECAIDGIHGLLGRHPGLY